MFQSGNRLVIPFFILLVLLGACESTPDSGSEAAPGVFDFESGPGDTPQGWRGRPAVTLAASSEVVHSGAWSGRIQRVPDSEGSYSALSFHLPADRKGDFIELRGWLKSEDVDGWFGLWLRLDGSAGVLSIDNMEKKQLRGTTDWTEYRVRMYFAPETRTIVCGALMSGTGTLWADDFSLWIDDKPLNAAPMVERPSTILDTDREFAAGSGVDFITVTEEMTENLTLLGRVWGFLKYHHPAVTDGSLHWDFELFRILPRVLAVADRQELPLVLSEWIDGLGPIPACDPCAEAAEEPAQAPAIGWILDEELLGRPLSLQLQAVYPARPADGRQFWVSFEEKVGNPDFSREPGYANLRYLDAGYRLLALFRFWNIVEYWCPNRDVIGTDWPLVLEESVPLLVAADDVDSYLEQLLILSTRLNDTHTQLYGAFSHRPPGMKGQLPVLLRFIEDEVVVAGWAHATEGPASGLATGDVILAVDGKPVRDLVRDWAPFYSASNESRRMMDLARAVGRGPTGSCRLRILRDGNEIDLAADRIPYREIDHSRGRSHALPGAGFRMILPDVAYLALDGVREDSIATWMKDVVERGAGGLVIDCRAYPQDFSVFSLGGHLVPQATSFAAFTRPDPANPGAFLWHEGQPLLPARPYFTGKVAILVDEVSISSAEYHALAFAAAPRARVLGSTTAGADGNVSKFNLPGGLTTMLSGIGVFDVRHRPTQRVGIVPDVVVEPTIRGIAAGRDEVLEAAAAWVLGRPVTAEETAAWSHLD